MAQVNESKGAFGGVDPAELSAWKRHPATAGLVAEMQRQVNTAKEVFWNAPYATTASEAFSIGKMRGTAQAYENVAELIEGIK